MDEWKFVSGEIFTNRKIESVVLSSFILFCSLVEPKTVCSTVIGGEVLFKNNYLSTVEQKRPIRLKEYACYFEIHKPCGKACRHCISKYSNIRFKIKVFVVVFR